MEKRNKFLSGMLAMALMFGFVLTGCAPCSEKGSCYFTTNESGQTKDYLFCTGTDCAAVEAGSRSSKPNLNVKCNCN